MNDFKKMIEGESMAFMGRLKLTGFLAGILIVIFAYVRAFNLFGTLRVAVMVLGILVSVFFLYLLFKNK